MHISPRQQTALDQLRRARYALLRTYRRDGTPVDTPIWFRLDERTAVFRTKVGPKTKRLAARPDVQLAACDYKGRLSENAVTVTGRATILTGDAAQAGNRALRERYGWQWNIVPLMRVPGVTNVHRDLSIREKLRRARDQRLWADSVIVRVDFD